ncbi:MAG: hypothetical protein RL177_294 [Bacteroidota bacterium]
MLKFKINEIEEGESVQDVTVAADDLALGVDSGDEFHVQVVFDRTRNMIQARLLVEGTLHLVCDRSLETFEYPVEADYTVIFKPELDEETEDDQVAVRRLNMPSNLIDITRDVRDTLLLTIPIRKLHPRFVDEDGQEIPFETPYASEPETDPRWAALTSLTSAQQKN